MPSINELGAKIRAAREEKAFSQSEVVEKLMEKGINMSRETPVSYTHLDVYKRQVHHLPESILADRGELEGRNVENIINSLHVKVQNTPPYRADWKAVIEQHFRITNLRVKPLLPGTVNPDVRERGDRDYRLDAKLDIYQFTQIIIKCALYHNNQYYLKNLSLIHI